MAVTQNTPGQVTGQYFVVTGSTQGLGAAVAQLLAERGAAGIVICGRSRDKGEQQARQLAEWGTRAHFVQADMEKVEDCRAVIAAAERHFGTLHGLVNCAGMSDRGSIVDTSPERFDRIMATNVRAPFFLTQEAIRLMLRTGTEGAIVNIISMTGHGGQSFLSAYATAKGALQTLTRNTAFSAMHNRIRVNGLNIGWMNTPHEHEIQQRFHGASGDWLAKASAEQPFGRLLEPKEVARAVAFLVSAESGMMTGALVDFDQSVLGCCDAPARPAEALSF